MRFWNLRGRCRNRGPRHSCSVGAGALSSALVILATALVSPAGAAAPDPSLVHEFAADPLSFFFELRAPEAIACSQVLLTDTSLPEEERRGILTALGAIHFATGRERQAEAAFLTMLRDAPDAPPDQADLLPPPVLGLYYQLQDSLLLATDDPPRLDIRTLAVGDIENNSIVEGAFDLDRFARGLTQIITTDLMETTPLKIVDRARLAVIRKEIQLSTNDRIVDPRYRVPFGKLTGAQSFLFGSLIQAEKNRMRLDLRWVDTSTGEILLSEGVEAKVTSTKDLFKLERTVLIEKLMPQIERLLEGGEGGADLERTMESTLKKRRRALPKDQSYVDLLLKTGEALLAEERGDLAAARDAWTAVDAIHPADAAAAHRARALTAYLNFQNEE